MKNLRARLKECEGSFTLEASLVMPVVLFTTMILLFLSLYMYQQSMLHQAASAAAERTAYSWDNSHKEALDGSVPVNQYDSLYWRMTDDQWLGSLFGWAGAENSQTVPVPSTSSTQGALTAIKLSKTGSAIPAGMQGDMTYKNAVLQRKVTASLNQIISLRPLDAMLDGGSELRTSGSSLVVDPVEFIRSIHLMRYYGSKFKKNDAGEGMDRGNAAGVLQQLQTSGSQP
ncbi:TadE family protein [Paenibacillus cellulositrophicus]|uniref:TadE family protein n=1 Tax=Paenibacillus cellulositrophicus TaxID=562959 RepID=UPI003F7F5291